MYIELLAAKAWRAAAERDAAQNEVKQVALEMVTDNIITRLESGKDVSFDQEVSKIHMDTDGDPATEKLLLEQMQGIANVQSPSVGKRIKAMIARLK